MNNYELDVVRCLNTFFSGAATQGFAYRLKQAKFNSQYVDVLVDSLDPRYYLAIECKSIKGKKIYFSQHFHNDKNGIHQIDSISSFLQKTGRRGYLSVEFRAGPGRPKEAFLMPWDQVLIYYTTEVGITQDEFREHITLNRSQNEYILPALYPK